MNRTETLGARPLRIGFWQAAFGALLLGFGVVTVLRFTRGLGAAAGAEAAEGPPGPSED